MKRQWALRRAMVATADGQRRWDRAYQRLLSWTMPNPQPPVPSASEQLAEVADASSGLCAGLDPAPGAGADDRAATGTAAGPRHDAGVAAARGARVPRRRLQRCLLA